MTPVETLPDRDECIRAALDRRKHILSEYREHLEMVAINGPAQSSERAARDYRHLEAFFGDLLAKQPVSRAALDRRKHILQDFKNCVDMLALCDAPERAKVGEQDYTLLVNLFRVLTKKA